MYRAKYFPNLFCRYERKGKGWIKDLPVDELKAFIHLGLMYADYGRMGGKVRGRIGKRDHRGKFVKENRS
jgi:hypothetical protein